MTVQIEESMEAQRKFAGAKSISSAQYFGEQNKVMDAEGQVRLQKFQVGGGLGAGVCGLGAGS